MTRTRIALIAMALAGAASVHAADYSGNDWVFNYSGKLEVASVTAAGALAGLGVGVNLGNVTATNQAVSVTQSSSSAFAANGISIPILGSGLLLNGTYTGSVSGTGVTLTRPAIAGAGVSLLSLVNAQLNIPTTSLVGDTTGINNAVTGAYGSRAYQITGNGPSSSNNNIGLSASILNVQTNLGLLKLTTDSWSLTRSASAPVPEPTSMAALGLGAFGLLRRRRNRK